MTKKNLIITVILKPHNVAFQTRTLELKEKQKIRIGRQTSSKTLPTIFNGFFDSKVLSRQHAELWCEKSKAFIKDVKSSNGTFINGERLSNEGEESEPKELNDKDEIEFGIDIINDNGSIMYHKVSCTAYIYPMPLSQIEEDIIRDLLNNSNSVQVYPDPHLSRKSSTSSINTLSSIQPDLNIVENNNGKNPKKLESVLLKLQSEIDRSKQVENELKSIKETVVDLERLLSEERMKKNTNLEVKLSEAEAKIKTYEMKWKSQHQAINTAKNELKRLENELSNQNKTREKLIQDLQQEQQKTKLLEEKLQKLANKTSFSFFDAIQIKSVQFIFAVLIGIISTLIYVLYN